MSSDGSDDEDYAYSAPSHHHSLEKRYPVHDACEFDDIETLRSLITELIDEDEENQEHHDGDDDESSSDENDSTAAAHAAATGHSPLPSLNKPSPTVVTNALTKKDKNEEGNSSSAKASAEGADSTDQKGNSVAEEGGGRTPVAGDQERAKDEEPKTPRASNTGEKVDTPKEVEVEASPKDAASGPDANINNSQIKESHADNDSSNKPVPMEVDEPALTSASPDKSPTGGSGTVDSDLSRDESIATGAQHQHQQHQNSHTPPGANEKADSASAETPTPTRPKQPRYRLPSGVNLNEKDEDENTALHVAIHARKLQHVKLLLEMGASFRLKCDGSFAIHTAISMGSMRQHQQFAYDCVVALHEAGADLTVKDDAAHTPLFLACMFNLPQIVTFILSNNNDDENEQGHSTLNLRADRAGNRPLHAAAKFDTLTNPSKGVATPGGRPHAPQHHPDGTVVTPKPIPGFPGKVAANPSAAHSNLSNSSSALLTQVLLGTSGIEVDAVNGLGQTALHVACSRGNWPVARLLLQADSDPHIADRRGFTPGQVAYKRGMPIPVDLLTSLGDPPESGIIPPPRDMIVDPDGSTAIITHELCILHRTCAPIRRDSPEPPPENVRRLQVLTDQETGILKTGEFGSCIWKNEARRAAMADILKCHEYNYVESISQMAATIPDHPSAIAHLDPDTTVSRWSFEAALRAAGSVCEAVDLVMSGEYRNSFCAVRPPGHHAGPRGIVKCANDPDGGSHGFCLLNNVAIGAAYARSMYRNEGIRKVAIIDFDVHHGNGTEEILRQLVPVTEKVPIRTPFAFGDIASSTYRPWLDETDIQNVFFASTHGYGNRGYDQPGWFYPASGKTHTSESITHPAMVENPNLTDFLFSQTWARMGEDSKANCCKIINVGMELPELSSDLQGRNMKQRLDLRDVYRNKILPHLREFDPDLIFISAGFDAHRKDTMNFGYVGMVEDDYEWVTEQLIKVANTCCNGRVISVLEGGYKIHGGIVSPFARSVASHVRALVDGGRSRELFDPKDAEWESQYERHVYEKRERKKEEDREKLRLRMEAAVQHNARGSTMLDQMAETNDPPEDPDAPSRKRRRNNNVDYKELYKQMQQEGFGSG